MINVQHKEHCRKYSVSSMKEVTIARLVVCKGQS